MGLAGTVVNGRQPEALVKFGCFPFTKDGRLGALVKLALLRVAVAGTGCTKKKASEVVEHLRGY